MKTKFINFIKSVPLALSGVALGLAALGNVLRATFPIAADITGLDTIGIIRYCLASLSLFMLLLVVLRISFDFSHVKQELTYTHKHDEWKTSIPLSSLATVTMALMLLAGYIRPHAPVATFALVVWYIALVLQVGIMIFFAVRFIPKFKVYAVYPSWFIVAVGIVVASVTAVDMGIRIIGQISFYTGFILYFLVFTLVVIKMIRAKYFMEAARPTIAIFAAPMSLLIVGYFFSFRGTEQWSYPFFYFMLIFALLVYAFVLFKMLSLLRIKFYATYAGFTFPLVISATAFRIGANITRLRLGETALGFQIINTFAHFALWIAILACVFVIIHYIKYFIFWASFNKEDKKVATDIESVIE